MIINELTQKNLIYLSIYLRIKEMAINSELTTIINDQKDLLRMMRLCKKGLLSKVMMNPYCQL